MRQEREPGSEADAGRLHTDDFDEFVDGLDYPMFVVTAFDGARRAGCLVGFTTQASIDPPRMLVCLSDKNHTYDVARASAVLGVHVLDHEQRDLAELFGSHSGDDVDKFSRCSWRAGPDGVPLLDACVRRIVGTVLSQHPFGDHVGFLLEPSSLAVQEPGSGLSFEEVKDLEPGHDA
jgi:flavin reductase (DIM6/NTAB) family NADH-FMN oxidoreductase RutF